MIGKGVKIKGIEIDVRSKHSLYITIGDWVYYIDDSTNEQIVDKWHKSEQFRIDHSKKGDHYEYGR
jgi:hypothetical protein